MYARQSTGHDPPCLRCSSHPLAAYFLIVFAGAWAVWLPMVASARGLIGVRFPSYVLWAAGLAPIGSHSGRVAISPPCERDSGNLTFLQKCDRVFE